MSEKLTPESDPCPLCRGTGVLDGAPCPHCAAWEASRATRQLGEDVAAGRVPRAVVPSEIVAVLVVPADGDPGGLLAVGPLYSHPPVVSLTSAGWFPGRGGTAAAALPLWWDGALVPEGWDRARRAMYATVPALDGESEPWCLLSPGLRDVLWAADRMASGRRVAARVVRLARVDGRLVEVTT